MTGKGAGNDVILEVQPPDECDKKALDAFESLVRAGGEVQAPGLRKRMGYAHALAFARDAGEVIGVGALKRPVSTYRDRVFTKAGLECGGASYHCEVGWLFVIDPRRGEGLGRRLTKACVEAGAGRPIYATSSIKNTRMHGLLEELRFCRAGKPYASDWHDDTLVLYVRTGADQEK